MVTTEIQPIAWKLDARILQSSEEKNVKYVSGEEVLSYIIKMSQFNTNDKESNKKIIKIFEYTLYQRRSIDGK